MPRADSASRKGRPWVPGLFASGKTKARGDKSSSPGRPTTQRTPRSASPATKEKAADAKPLSALVALTRLVSPWESDKGTKGSSDASKIMLEWGQRNLSAEHARPITPRRRGSDPSPRGVRAADAPPGCAVPGSTLEQTGRARRHSTRSNVDWGAAPTGQDRPEAREKW